MSPADVAPARLRFRAADTEVWEYDLSVAIDLTVLDEGERSRAAGFRFDRDRVRFLRRRAALRHTLAAYTSRPAAALEFRSSEFGKPALSGGPFFNASSSGDTALVAVSRSHPVGVDVEIVRPAGDEEAIARRLFAPEEVAAIANVEDFFRCWSRKEAYVKAVGHGLSFPLKSFAVQTGVTAAPRLLRSDIRPDDVRTAALFDVSGSCPQFAACVVVMGHRPLSSKPDDGGRYPQ